MLLTAQRAHNAIQGNPALATSQEAPVLLRTEGIKKAFGGQVVLDGVDLELRRGEVVLLRGENGSGKTTLLNILTGTLEPDAGAIHYQADDTPRSYHFPRRWWQELNPWDHFRPEFVAQEGIGRTWQDVRLFSSQTLRDNIAVAEPGHPGENPLLALFAPGRSVRRETALNCKADAMLARLGLNGRQGSSAGKISLGQSKRVAIARAIAAGARILFLDEPLAGLDQQGIKDVLDLLGTLVNDHKVTLVIVEHIFNQHYLNGLVTTDWLLANGIIRQVDGNGKGRNSTCFIPSASSVSSTQRPAWFALLAGKDAEVVDEFLPRGALLTRIRRSGVFKNSAQPVLKIRNLIVKRGFRTVIGIDDHGTPAGFDLTVFQSEIAILQAPNGWGKSTLLAALCGLIPADSGTISLQGESLDSIPAWERVHKGLRALPSDKHTFPSLKVREVLHLAGTPLASSMGRSLSGRVCSSLSGGERQRVAFSSVIQHGATSVQLLLDEPLVGYDREATEDAIREILKLQFRSILILVPTTQHLID